jgi:helix-turn-helix, Psq domain
MTHDRSKAGIRTRIEARALEHGKAARPWAAAFVVLIGQGVGVAEAARRLGVARSTLYAARVADPRFAARWDDAARAAWRAVSSKARIEPLFEGEAMPVFHGGQQVGVRRVFPKGSAVIRRLQKAYREAAEAANGSTPEPNASTQFGADDQSTLSNG